MPSREKITLEVVSRLASELEAEGVRVTSTAIYQRNGAYGSLTAINDHMKTWKAAQQKKLKKEAESIIPVPMPGNITELFVPIYESMARELMAHYDQKRSEDLTVIESQRVELTELKEDASSQREMIDTMQEEVEDHKTNAANHLRQLETCQLQASELMTEKSELEILLKQAGVDLKSCQKDLSAIKARLSKAYEAKGALQGKLEATESKAASLQTSLDQVNGNFTEALVTIKSLERDVEDLETAQVETNDRLFECQKNYEGAQKLIQEFQRIEARLNEREKSSQQARLDLQARIEILEAQLKSARIDNGKLAQANEDLKDRVPKAP